MKEKEICNDCGRLSYIYHKKKKQCQYCWKKERSSSWKANSKPKEPTRINPRSKKGYKTAQDDSKFFHQLWKSKPHFCENCSKDLGDDYNPVYFSHILSKGAYPNLRYYIDNINILCFKCHQEWEFGKRKIMPIYTKNLSRIQKMKSLLTSSL